jgi:hypothetical protein
LGSLVGTGDDHSKEDGVLRSHSSRSLEACLVGVLDGEKGVADGLRVEAVTAEELGWPS